MTTGYQCVLHMHTMVEDIEITNVNAKTETGGKTAFFEIWSLRLS
jgi:hypothetical protein